MIDPPQRFIQPRRSKDSSGQSSQKRLEGPAQTEHVNWRFTMPAGQGSHTHGPCDSVLILRSRRNMECKVVVQASCFLEVTGDKEQFFRADSEAYIRYLQSVCNSCHDI